jgi:exosortase
MQVIEEREAPVSSSTFVEEVQFYLGKLPDRTIFLALLVAWILLFYFFGWTSAIAGKTSSLYEWMWDKWTDPANDASHGKLIPWVVLGLLWFRRKKLVESVTGVWWPALIGLAFALLLHVLGFIVQQPRVSMIALFSGGWIFTGLVWGPKTLRVTFFPFVIFAFCVPLGGTFAQDLTLHLRLWAAQATEFVAGTLLGIPVARVGTKLYDPANIYGTFDVAAECSGIRSFTALLAITTIFSIETMRTFWKRALMIASSIPLAIICNVIRVTTIVLAANVYQQQSAGQFVDHYFGYVTYGIAIVGVLILARLLKEKPLPPASS